MFGGSRGPTWGEGSQYEQRQRPHPLDRKGDLVGPLVRSLLDSEQDAGGDELSDDPAQVDVCGEVASQSGGAYFRSVRYSRLYGQ
jgi:hypothetical protein